MNQLPKLSLLEKLISQPQQFNFFQAVRLLHSYLNFTQKKIFFESDPSLRFPVSAISKIQINRRINISVTFPGLFGASGFLPHHYTELLIQRIQLKDFALKNFLDIFNHRMISLFYQSHEKYHFYLNPKNITHIITCLTGVSKTIFEKNSSLAKENFLFYAAYFSHSKRSAKNLENMLADFFEISVAITPFQGKWISLSPSQWSRLSEKSNSWNQLGRNTVIGQKIWDEQSHFKITLGPLALHQFNNFLPHNIFWCKLIELTRRYISASLTFDIQLILNAGEIPDYQLNSANHTTLGRNLWLKNKAFTSNSR